MKKIPFLVVIVGTLLLLFGCATTGEIDRLSAYEPNPDLTPKEVVKVQMEAFRNNDEEDRGIEIAFRFASPTNRRNTGPVDRFAQMMEGPLYRPMLVYDEIRYGETLVRGRVALQRVELMFDDRRMSYEFYLIQQEGGEFDQCWMTEAVYVVPNPGSPNTFNA